MLELPLDIQRMIMDYIITRTDLKALCLTSRRFHFHAIPRLYERIDLRVWNGRTETDRLARSVAAGAGVHLRYTKTLIIDDFGFPYSLYIPECEITLDEAEDWDSNIEALNDERNSLLLTIINMFPNHSLRRFGLIGSRDTPSDLVEYLYSHQRSLKHLQCTASPDLYRLYHNLINLEVHYMNIELLQSDLQHLYNFGQHIQCLHLGSLYNGERELEMPSEFSPTSCMPKLRDLTLEDWNLDNLYHPLSRLFDFSALSRLSLTGSKHTLQFISALSTNAPSSGLKLEHIVTGGHFKDSDDEAYYFEWHSDPNSRTYLVDLLDVAPNISSLHINNGAWHDNHKRQVAAVHSIGPQLKALSFDFGMTDSGEPPLTEDGFDDICTACPNLEQLGYLISEAAYVPHTHETYGGRREREVFMTSLKRLKHLRTLHMRLTPFNLLGITGSVNDCKTTILTHQVQIIADTFFAQLAHACPLFGALVIGHDYPLQSRPGGVRPLPQFCFIKGKQSDSLGRVKTVGVKVSKEVLRATQPCTEILELDPSVEAWQRWATKVLG